MAWTVSYRWHVKGESRGGGDKVEGFFMAETEEEARRIFTSIYGGTEHFPSRVEITSAELACGSQMRG